MENVSRQFAPNWGGQLADLSQEQECTQNDLILWDIGFAARVPAEYPFPMNEVPGYLLRKTSPYRFVTHLTRWSPAPTSASAAP